MNNQRTSFYPQYNMMQSGRSTQNASMNRSSSDCSDLFDIINKSSFAMDDTRLFLDTHPDCSEAMEYFRKMEQIRNDAIREYEIQVGPILSYHSAGNCDDDWRWNQGPLPWESAYCSGRRA